ncbi:MAG: hypothetical protein ABSE36_13675 [Terracidiphilus sp.]
MADEDDRHSALQAAQYTYMTVRSNTLQSDFHPQFDALLAKNFYRLRESQLPFRVEAFNISNTTSFNAPSATVSSSSCCTVTSTSVRLRDNQFARRHDFLLEKDP